MPDTPIAGDRGDGYRPPMEERVSRVEEDLRAVRETMIRIEAKLDATLPHLATKAEVIATKADIIALRGEMIAGFADKPSKTYMWGILAVLLTAYACGLAGLAVLR